MSIPTYALVGFIKKNPQSNEAALKYFLFGALSSAIIVYGISITYGITGSTNIGEVIQGYSNLRSRTNSTCIIISRNVCRRIWIQDGIGAFPPMAYPIRTKVLPPTITTLLAAGTKKAGFAATIRIVVLGMVVLNLDWTLALGILAIMTMTIGNVAAIMQKNLARMLAYSSIAHAGYILIGLAVAPYSSLGLQGSLYQILNHAVMKGMAFIAVTGIVTTLAVTNLDKLKGLGQKNANNMLLDW